MKRWKLSWMVPLMIVSGCAEDSADRRPPVSALARPRRSAEVVSVLDVRAGDRSDAIDELRDRAADVGADEVVDTGTANGRDGTAAHGMAVRYRDPYRGRAYDLVGPVEVSAWEGHEDEALDELRERALAIHADLIVDVRFHYGEGGPGPTSLSGIALRFRPTPRVAPPPLAPPAP
jgi:uncharacterized protein YbjQ (UPF0145 family)